MIYFTSDTHFGSERTLQTSCRPFKDTKEMDEAIIKNWNDIVKNEDEVYHLGDFGNYAIIKKLNGKITIILGNYEQNDLKTNFKGNFSEFSNFLKELGFYNVVDKSMVLQLEDDANTSFYLTHKPIDCSKDYFNLFGHIHEKCKCKKFGLNVGIDCFNFAPATLEQVFFYKNAILNYYDKNVFMEDL